jgi:hypothetical protein
VSETPTNVTPPPDLTYGYVDGRIILAIGDRSDAGRMPDPVPADGMTVTFTPANTILKVASPTPATVIKQPIVCSVDANGYLIDGQGARGVWLVTGTYKVTYSHSRAIIPPHDIEVTTGHTEIAPLDLTTAMPPGGPVLAPSEYAELNGRLTILEAGGGGGGGVTWSTISGKPAVVAEGATQADARTAIGAGTSSFTGAYADLTGKPTTMTPTAHAATHAAAGSDPVTLSSAQISDLTETVQDIVGAFIVAGTNVTVTYNDAAGTFTINATASGGSTDPEIVRDVIGAAMVAGSGVQITVNDSGDTITIASTAVLPTRQIISGTGLNGGGDLSADRTLSVAYGTTAGTAAQGNDSRLSDARTPTAHTHTASQVSDSTATGRSLLTAVDAADARTAIGAGTSNLVVGTGAGDAKAGNYRPTAANVSDSTTTGRALLTAADAAAARTALSLGDAATKNTGTTAGTVAAGDDSRIGKIGGTVTVTGTPTAGQVPIASSGTAAAWGTVSGGGGFSMLDMFAGVSVGDWLPHFSIGGHSNVTMTAGWLLLSPVLVKETVTVDRIEARVETAAAATVHFAMYTRTGTNTYAISGSSLGTFDASSTGVKTVTLGSAMQLTPGIHLVGGLAIGASPVIWGMTGGLYVTRPNGDPSAGTNAMCTGYSSGHGSLPSAPTFTYPLNGSLIPKFSLKVSAKP